jgi:hypothetical protein
MVTTLGVSREDVTISLGVLGKRCGHSFGRAQERIVINLCVPNAWHFLGCPQGMM